MWDQGSRREEVHLEDSSATTHMGTSIAVTVDRKKWGALVDAAKSQLEYRLD